MAKKQRDPGKERFWRGVVSRWRKSGLSIRAYCEAEDLKESAFYFWRRELSRRGRAVRRSQRGPTALFVPVHVQEESPDRAVAGIEIVLAGGQRLRVSPGFDRQVLAEVLVMLEGRPC